MVHGTVIKTQTKSLREMKKSTQKTKLKTTTTTANLTDSFLNMIFLLHFKEKVYVYVLLFFNDSRSQFVAPSSFLNVVDVDVVFFVVDGVGFLAALLAAVLGAIGGGSLFNLKKS